MENVNFQEILDQFKNDFGITLTQEQVNEYVSFIKKKLEAQPKPGKASEELSDDEVEGVAGGTIWDMANIDEALEYCDAPKNTVTHEFHYVPGFPGNIWRCSKCNMCVDGDVSRGSLYGPAARMPERKR